jgi:hypothetical protein
MESQADRRLNEQQAKQHEAGALSYADDLTYAMHEAIDQIHQARPDFTANDVIMLIGEAVTHVLDVFTDEDLLREEYGVADHEIPTIIAWSIRKPSIRI